MNEIEFQEIVHQVFNNIPIFNNICVIKVPLKSIYIIYFNKIAFIKSPFKLKETKVKDKEYYNYCYKSKEHFIEDLIVLKNYILKDNKDLNISDILQNIELIKQQPINVLRKETYELLDTFDNSLYPFNDNKLYNYSINDLNNLNNIRFKCDFINKKKFNYEIKEDNINMGYELINDYYKSKTSITSDGDSLINITHSYCPNIEDKVEVLEYLDKKTYIRLSYDIMNCLIKSNNTTNEVKSIHLQLLNEYIQNTNNSLKEYLTKKLTK